MSPTLDALVQAFFKASRALPSLERTVCGCTLPVVACTRTLVDKWDVVLVSGRCSMFELLE